jgi:hypothetical protein
VEIFHKPNVLGGEEARVARSSMDQRVRAWRKGGFEALKPKAREASPKVSGGIAQGLGRGARYGRATAARHPERTAAHMCAVIAAAKGERRTNALSSAISVPPSSSGWHRRPGPSSAVSRLLGRTSRGCATPFTAPVLGCHKAIG